MSKPKIVTVNVCPPIPLRDFDWGAYRDGTEEDGIRGWGRTESEAVADLLDIEEDME